MCVTDLREVAKSDANGLGAAAYSARMERITVEIAKEWLTVADICEYMDVSPFVVTSQLRSGNLPAVKFGREWRVARIDFEDWINAQRRAAAARARFAVE